MLRSSLDPFSSLVKFPIGQIIYLVDRRCIVPSLRCFSSVFRVCSKWNDDDDAVLSLPLFLAIGSQKREQCYRRNRITGKKRCAKKGRAVNPGYRQCSVAFTSNPHGNGDVSPACYSYFGQKFHYSPRLILETRIEQTLTLKYKHRLFTLKCKF